MDVRGAAAGRADDAAGGETQRPVKRARVTRPGSWDDFKGDIHELYAVKNYSIEDLMTAMAEKGLHASYVFPHHLCLRHLC